MMAKCNHENIAKFYGLELIENTSHRYAMAMEFCADGNLQEMIDANRNGLEPSEFFRVVEHVVTAIEHLHSQQIIHRDLKPDNILVSKIDKQNVYKIADFGAARQLQANETSSSLYGTYEYLHPKIFAMYYYKALNIIPPNYSFNESHEFWSLGVLFYESATGQLPFLTKNGRNDPKIMYEMISNKDNDQIAAMECKKGIIKWTKELPESCQIKNNHEVTQFLAGLLKVSIILIFYNRPMYG